MPRVGHFPDDVAQTASLLATWGLSDQLVEAVASHHYPGHSGGSSFSPPTAVYAANLMADDTPPVAPGQTEEEPDYLELFTPPIIFRNGVNGSSRRRSHFSISNRADLIYRPRMKQWVSQYIEAQKAALDSIPAEKVAELVDVLATALKDDKQILCFGNGGSAANCSHFATDLGKGASDKIGRRFRVISLNDNTAWMTAIGNDYSYDDVFLRQLENFGRPGDVVLSLSVSGNSPNCVKALEWSKNNGLVTIALVGAKQGRMAEIADHVLTVDETHYGRAEDAEMGVCHMLCYAFMEKPEIAR